MIASDSADFDDRFILAARKKTAFATRDAKAAEKGGVIHQPWLPIARGAANLDANVWAGTIGCSSGSSHQLVESVRSLARPHLLLVAMHDAEASSLCDIVGRFRRTYVPPLLSVVPR